MIRFQRLFAATLGVATSLALAPGMLMPPAEASSDSLVAQADTTENPCALLQLDPWVQ